MSKDSSVPLMHTDPSDLGLICLVKKRKIRFLILDFLKETHLKYRTGYCSGMFMADVSERTFFHTKDPFSFASNSLPLFLFKSWHEYRSSRFPIKITRLAFALFSSPWSWRFLHGTALGKYWSPVFTAGNSLRLARTMKTIGSSRYCTAGLCVTYLM